MRRPRRCACTHAHTHTRSHRRSCAHALAAVRNAVHSHTWTQAAASVAAACAQEHARKASPRAEQLGVGRRHSSVEGCDEAAPALENQAFNSRTLEYVYKPESQAHEPRV